jgi:hypothetical protein
MATPIKYYTDEHIADAVVEGLRQRGIDVLTTQEAALLGAPDSDHLERALSEGRAIVTQDADFLRLDADGHEHSGIVYAPQGSSVGAMVRLLVLIHEVYTAEEFHGSVEFL